MKVRLKAQSCAHAMALALVAVPAAPALAQAAAAGHITGAEIRIDGGGERPPFLDLAADGG